MQLRYAQITLYLAAFLFIAGFHNGLAQDQGADNPAAVQMQKMAFTLGTYEGRSEMADGRIYRVRMESEWWIEGRSITGQSWDAFDDGAWQPYYKGFQNWHGGRQQVIFQSAGRDGDFVNGHIEMPDDATVYMYWTVVNATGITQTGRDTWAFNADRSAFLWTFATEMAEGNYEPYFKVHMERIN